MFVKMNDLIIADRACIPIVNRPVVAAISNRLKAPLSGWDNEVWLVSDWYKE